MEVTQDILKIEDQNSCLGCLSGDRQIYPLGQYLDIYLFLTKDQRSEYAPQDLQFCWECIARFKNIKNFQTQLIEAQNALFKIYHGFSTPLTLSKLTIAKSTHLYQYREIQSECMEIPEENNPYIDDIKDEVMIKTEYSFNSDNSLTIENESDNIICEYEKLDEEDNTPDVNSGNLTLENDNDDNDQTQSDDKSDDYRDDGYKHDIRDKDYVPEDDDYVPDITVKKKIKHDEKEKEKMKLISAYHKAVNTDYYIKINDNEVSGDIKKYFVMTKFDEQQMEEHILAKQRDPSKPITKYPYRCKRCNLGYTRAFDVRRHRDLNHVTLGIYRCTRCRKTLGSHDELKSHWREHTSVAQCKLCEQFIHSYTGSLQAHIDSSHRKKYACRCCTMTFRYLVEFGKHFKENHMEYICDYCNKTFKTKPRLISHISNHHMPAYCKECNREFVSQLKYRNHCVYLHPLVVNKELAPKELRFCVECDKEYPTETAYKMHLLKSFKHTDVRPKSATCPECGKFFTQSGAMKTHYKFYHLKKIEYHCQICDKSYARRNALESHNKAVHLNIKAVKDKICDLCGKGFSSNRVLRNHRATHTGEKFYKCMYCTAEFIQKHAMQTHMRTQHKHNAKT